MISRLIVAAGMQRSGSTWLYNAIRYCYLCAGRSVYACFEDTYDPGVAADTHVVKTHYYHPELHRRADLVITTWRDPLDIAASCVRKGYIPDEPAPVVGYLRGILYEQYDSWHPHTDLEIPYDQIRRAPSAQIEKILDLLGLPGVDATEVARDVLKLTRCVFVACDPATQLWPHHITDGATGSYGETLSPATIDAVNALVAQWRS